MKPQNYIKNRALLVILATSMSASIFAQDQKELNEAADSTNVKLTQDELKPENHSNDAAQANNPLASFKALNIQNYYMPTLTNAPNGSYMNSSWLRYAQPMANGRMLLRISAPMSSIRMPDSEGITKTTSGLGDINGFLSYSFVSKSNATIGAGPLLVAPTAQHQALGSGKWQGGLAAVAYIIPSKIFQYGALVTWQASFAGDQNRDKTSLMAIQPIYFWQMGGGTYLRGAPIWNFDFTKDSYAVPVGMGVGKVVPFGNTVVNMFIEPQYTFISSGTQAQFQIYAGLNLQFKNKKDKKK